MRQVAVIDAGVGNLGNLARALAYCGGRPETTADPETVARSRCIVLPGVGAFAPPRERLRESGVDEALGRAVAEGAWLLGICVGYQLLFEASEEFGETDGLGFLTGRVRALPPGVPRPHIGWNRLHDLAEHPLTAGLAEGDYAYFVHGYAPDGVAPAQVLARTTHGCRFPAIAGAGRVLGTQFHPEKSGATGLAVLRRFLEMADGADSGD